MIAMIWKTFVLRAISAVGGVTFLFSASLFDEPSLVGAVATAQSLMMCLAIISIFGANTALTKEIAIIGDEGKSSLWGCCFVSVIVGLVLGGLVLISALNYPAVFDSVWIGRLLPYFVFSVLPISIGFLFAGYLKGVGKPASAVIQENGAISLLASVLVLLLWAGGFRDPIILGVAFSISSILFVVFGLLMVGLGGRVSVRSGLAFFARSKDYFMSGLSDYLYVNFVVVMSAIYLGAEEAGILKVSERLALLVSFSLVVVNAIYGKFFASLYHQANFGELGRKYRQSILVGVTMGAPFCAVLILFPGLLLDLFGYEDGSWVVRIMAFANLINVLCGSVVLFLNMTSSQVFVRNASVVVTFFGVLGVWLAMKEGLIWVALVLAAVMIVKNIVMLSKVLSRFGPGFVMGRRSVEL